MAHKNKKLKLSAALMELIGGNTVNKKEGGCIFSTKEVGDTFVFNAKWDNDAKEEACKEILAILEMKVGPRTPETEIYYQVNEFCNQFDLNSSFDFLSNKIKEHFAGTPNLEEIIYTVLD